MRFKLTKADANINCYCSRNDCKQKDKYFEKPIFPDWKPKIKLDSVIAVVLVGTATEVYCRDCIDKVYLEFSSVFNSKLWAFR